MKVISALESDHFNVSGLPVLLLGASSRPWLPALLLSVGRAEHVTVLDYVSTATDHPKITAVTMAQLPELR